VNTLGRTVDALLGSPKQGDGTRAAKLYRRGPDSPAPAADTRGRLGDDGPAPDPRPPSGDQPLTAPKAGDAASRPTTAPERGVAGLANATRPMIAAAQGPPTAPIASARPNAVSHQMRVLPIGSEPRDTWARDTRTSNTWARPDGTPRRAAAGERNVLAPGHAVGTARAAFSPRESMGRIFAAPLSPSRQTTASGGARIIPTGDEAREPRRLADASAGLAGRGANRLERDPASLRPGAGPEPHARSDSVSGNAPAGAARSPSPGGTSAASAKPPDVPAGVPVPTPSSSADPGATQQRTPLGVPPPPLASDGPRMTGNNPPANPDATNGSAAEHGRGTGAAADAPPRDPAPANTSVPSGARAQASRDETRPSIGEPRGEGGPRASPDGSGPDGPPAHAPPTEPDAFSSHPGLAPVAARPRLSEAGDERRGRGTRHGPPGGRGDPGEGEGAPGDRERDPAEVRRQERLRLRWEGALRRARLFGRIRSIGLAAVDGASAGARRLARLYGRAAGAARSLFGLGPRPTRPKRILPRPLRPSKPARPAAASDIDLVCDEEGWRDRDTTEKPETPPSG
jgi:hypothetical protein